MPTPVLVFPERPDGQSSPIFHRLNGIQEQIGQNLLDLMGVDMNLRQSFPRRKDQGDTFCP